MLAKADLLISSIFTWEMSPSCCSIDENSKWVEVGFFWCCCFCGVSWFCCGVFCEGGSWGTFFVWLFF